MVFFTCTVGWLWHLCICAIVDALFMIESLFCRPVNYFALCKKSGTTAINVSSGELHEPRPASIDVIILDAFYQ
jgi:hypothetical protein